MQFNVIIWDLSKDNPELMADYWCDKKEANRRIKNWKNHPIFEKGYVIDFSSETPRVIAKLGLNRSIIKYK